MKRIFIIIIMTALNGLIGYGQIFSKSNKCLSFNGQTSDVSFNNNDFKLDAGNTLTVTAWIKWNNMSNAPSWTNMVTLNSNTGNGDQGQFWFQHNQVNSKFEFAVQTVTGRTFIQSSVTPQVGVWYHLAGVYDGSNIILYVNGIFQGKNSLSGTINNYRSDFKFNIGKWASSSTAYRRFNGDIDEVTLWNIALSQMHIRTNMCQSLKGNEYGLLGYWPMDNMNSSILYDATSNNRNGTFVNALTVESGAAVGNQSIYTYGGSKLALVHPLNKDSLVIENFNPGSVGFHVYRIDSSLNVTTPPAGFKNILPYYYGVFSVNPTGQVYQTTYYYTGHPDINASTILGLAGRIMESDLVWNDLKITNNLTAKIPSLVVMNQMNRNNFIIGELDIALPVSFIEFNAFQDGNHVRLDWSTTNESDNDLFVIEKSQDAIHFEILDSVVGDGKSIQMHHYSFNDHSLIQGVVYYRLGQRDLNSDKIAYSSIISLNQKSSDVFEMITTYPNPFQDKINIGFVSNYETEVVFKLVTFNGIEMFENTITAFIGYNSYCFEETLNLDKGLYMLIVSDNKKLIKQIRVIKY